MYIIVLTVNECDLGMNSYYKLIFWLDKRYNSQVLIGQNLLSCSSCPIRVWAFNNRSSLAGTVNGERWEWLYLRLGRRVLEWGLSDHTRGERLLQTHILIGTRNNSVALVQSELGSCTSCPIRVWVCNNRSPLYSTPGPSWSRQEPWTSSTEFSPCSTQEKKKGLLGQRWRGQSVRRLLLLRGSFVRLFV